MSDSLEESRKRKAFLRKHGNDAGSTFLPAGDLSRLQSALYMHTMKIQEYFIEIWFPELKDKDFLQKQDWMARNQITFQCVEATRPDPNKMERQLTYVCYRKTPEIKKAFVVIHSVKPLTAKTGFSASCSFSPISWPKQFTPVSA